MKTLIAAILTLSFSSSFAFAKAEMSVQQVVNRYNDFYPTLQLSVAKPAKQEVLYQELEILGDALNGEDVPAGDLIHLACCAVACGGSGCTKH